MAIRAQKQAFARLRPSDLDRSSHAVLCEAEFLRAWIEMMELKRSVTTGVAADRALASGFHDEHPLHATATSRHGLAATFRAAVTALRTEDVPSYAVPLANEFDVLGTAMNTR